MELTLLPEKVADLLNAETPKDTTQLKSLLGMLNYYRRDLPNLWHILEPLHKLLLLQSFEKINVILCLPNLVIHYYPPPPVPPCKLLVLACGMSPYELGAVLSHTLLDGSGKPRAYLSKTLSSSGKNYTQIKKESLAIIFVIKKFHQYIYYVNMSL